ncbi:MAG: hypothetical protein ACI865_000674 [Flavobacteriaceae bacterium]|jgi:hypothetical protein
MKFIFAILLLLTSFHSLCQQRLATATYTSDNSHGVGIILDNDTWLIEPKYDKIVFWHNHFSVQENGNYGCIDTNGRLIIQPKYQSVLAYDNYILLKSKDTTYGATKLNGELLLEPIYSWITEEDGSLTYKIDGKTGLVDTAGTNLLNPVFDEIRFLDAIVFVQRNGLWGEIKF